MFTKQTIFVSLLVIMLMVITFDTYKIVCLKEDCNFFNGKAQGTTEGATVSLDAFLIIEKTQFEKVRELEKQNQRFRDVCQLLNIDPEQVLGNRPIRETVVQPQPAPKPNYNKYPKDM